MAVLLLLSLFLVSGLFLIVWFLIKRRGNRQGHIKPGVSDNSQLTGEQLQANLMFESITDGVVVVDNTGTVKMINASGAQMFGWGKHEATNIHYSAFFKPLIDTAHPISSDNESPAVKKDDVIAATIKTGQPNQKVLQIRTKSDRQPYIDVIASPIFQEDDKTDKNGQPLSRKLVGVIAVFRDVDQQKREEQQRAEFISTASHEMRTPVAAIEGYLALAMNDKVCLIDEKARSYLNKAHSSTQHLGQLFQDLLTSAKADDGRLSSHPSVVEFNEFLKSLTEDLQFAVKQKGLGLKFEVGNSDNSSPGPTIQPLYYAYVDPDRIREVITNLFDNAVKYTPSGSITIGLTGNEEVVQFYIRDTGSGIPAEDIPHLFQKFYRVDNTATRTIGGTGLGLFICRKIVELYKGKIWVDSQQGKGSTFYVNLPRLSNQKAQSLLANQKPENQEKK